MAVPELIDIQVAQAAFGAIVVAWRAAPGAVVPAGVVVEVQRSYSPQGGYVSVQANIPLATGVCVDAAHNIQQAHRTAYYRLVVTTPHDDPTPDETRTYLGPYHLRDQPDRIGRTIIRNMELLLAAIGASPVLIYQPGYGEHSTRCPDCWDETSQQTLYSNCQTCSGSGFVGQSLGYYQPILTLMDIRPPEKLRSLEDTAQDPVAAVARMANYPVLRPADLVRELNTGTIWRVVAVTPQRKDARAVLTQDPVQLRQVKPGDIEFDLPVPTSLTPILRRRRARLERVVGMTRGGAPTVTEVFV